MSKKELSQLDKDIRDAERLGFGVHYGRFKAHQEEEKELARERARAEAATRNMKAGEQIRKLLCRDCKIELEARFRLTKTERVGRKTTCYACGQTAVYCREFIIEEKEKKE